ncbi:MAG TPA: filamentous hemagglutinin N-terminal domain-containing protein [Pseudomonadales bacterium]|nr:filamentous hemagglutinin N-terminal domain-containing protein [Pseudomonadales bacterium]
MSDSSSPQRSGRALVFLCALACASATPPPARADLRFDGSLGPVATLSGDMVVGEAFGTLSADGGNLFHSFERLNVDTGESLHFAVDSLTVQNIIGRVTGVDGTFIDGPVSADVDLFVVNPNGVIFGAGASFDPSVIISFEAADTVFFDDGSVFRVRATDAAATLSIASPDAFGFVSVATDGSLAPGQALLTAENDVALIGSDAGLVVGRNQFLSFSAFSIYPEQGVALLADAGTRHLVARVTSLEDSLVNGALTVLDTDTLLPSNATLWFSNPQGVVLGPGAFLDTVSALHVGAAVEVLLDDGGAFGASNAPTAGVPVGFDVTGAAGGVTVDGADLETGRALSLVGRTLTVDDARLRAPYLSLLAPSTGIALVDEPQGGVPGDDTAGDVLIRSSDLEADVFGPGAGPDDPRLVIVGGRLVQITDSLATADTAGSALGTVVIRGADVDITQTRLSANTQSDVAGSGAEIRIEGDATLSLVSSLVEADTTGGADAGDLLLTATSLTVRDSTLFAESFAGASGNAGSIALVGGDIVIDDGSVLASRALAGTGDAGSVTLIADDSVLITGDSAIETSSIGDGDAGRILISAPSITASTADLASSSRSPRDDTLLVGDAVLALNAALGLMLSATTEAELVAAITPVFEAALAIDLAAVTPIGLVEEILLEADVTAVDALEAQLPFTLIDLAGVTTMRPPPGAVGSAGAILLAGDTIELDDVGLSTITASTDVDGSSLIAIEATSSLRITNSVLESDTRGVSAAGEIALVAPDLEISGTSVFAESFDTGTGDAGNIRIEGARILLADRTLVASRALTGTGNAGTAVIVASESLEVRSSDVETSSLGDGDAGSMQLGAPVLTLTDAFLSSSSRDGGLGGPVGEAGTIDLVGMDVTLTDSLLETVTGATVPGEPATISISASGRLGLDGTEVRADTSGPASAGAVLLDGTDVDIRRSSIQAQSLPVATGDAGLVFIGGDRVVIADDSEVASRVLSDGGDAGGVRIEAAESLTLGLGTRIETSSTGRGDAGVIDLEAPLIEIVGAELASTSAPDPAAVSTGDVGAAGAILLAGATVLLDDAHLTATTAGTGADAPSIIEILATDRLGIDSSRIESDTFGSSAAGNVVLSAPDLTLTASSVFAESFSTGDAGNIFLSGARLVVEDESTLASSARSGSGDAGTVALIATESLTISGDSLVETSSIGSGDAGLIVLEAPLLSISGSTLRSTSEALFQPVLLVADAAAAFDAAFGTTLTVQTPEALLLAITPLYEAALGIVIDAVTPGDFVDQVFELADLDAVVGFHEVLPFELFDLATLSATANVATAVGDAGAISLAGAVIELDGATLSTTTSATREGRPSDIDIVASERLTARDTLIEADTYGVASAGSVSLNAPVLEFGGVLASRSTDNSLAPRDLQPLAAAFGIDAAGLNVQELLGVLVTALEGRLGVDLEATTGTAVLDELLREAPEPALESLFAELDAAGVDLFVLDDLDRPGPMVTGLGSAGTIALQGGDISLLSADVTTTSEATVDGLPASIDIVASGALVAVDTVIAASTGAVARAGDISLSAAGLQLTDTLITAESRERATGDAGSVSLTAGTDAELAGTAVTSRSLSATGAAGAIRLFAGEDVVLRGSDAGRTTSLSTTSSGAGRAGDILVEAATVSMTDRAAILSESLGTSDSGNVLLDLGTRLDMTDSKISTNSERARGGDITVITRGSEIFLTRSSIEASAGATGTGGNILLLTDFLVLDHSAVLATAVAGNGGKIDIFADAVLLDFFSIVSADSETGNSGTVNISAPDTDISAAMSAQDASPLVVPELVSDRCAPGAAEVSRLIVRPSTPVRSLPEAPRTLIAAGVLPAVAALQMPCSQEGS